MVESERWLKVKLVSISSDHPVSAMLIHTRAFVQADSELNNESEELNNGADSEESELNDAIIEIMLINSIINLKMHNENNGNNWEY